MHQHVGRGDQLAHAVGEPERADARVVAVAALEALAHLVVASGDADHARHVDVEGAPDRSVEIADPPASTGHQDDAAHLGQAE